MKRAKRFSVFLAACLLLTLLASCGQQDTKSDPTPDTGGSSAQDVIVPSDGGAVSSTKYSPEVADIKVSYFSFCGQLHQFIAADKGYLEEEGLNVEEVIINSGADAFTALSAGTTDVLLTYSTVTPLSYIANGNDFTMFAGNMAQGATPLFTLESTEYNGFEDLVGKRIGITRNGGGTETIVLKHELTEAGYDVDKDFTWVEVDGAMGSIEGVKNGELDFAFNMTGYDLIRQQYGMKDVFYPDDYVPMYSCCRIVARTEWVEDNPETVKALLRAYARAGAHFDETDYVIQLMMDKLDQEKDHVESYMLNPHYIIHLDPLKNSILRDWQWCLDFGIFESNGINIEDHINTQLYKEVIDDLSQENPNDDYYAGLQEMYAEYNT